MNSKELEPDLNLLDSLIREGRGNEARKALLAIGIRKLPRAGLVQFANIARRIGLSHLSIRAMHRIIRPEGAQVSEPTAQEWIEYAGALIEIGAIAEAQEILEKREIQKAEPKAYLFSGLCLFRNWQYGEAVPVLTNYIKLAPDRYSKTVGEVNLAAAFVATGQAEPARALLTRLLLQTKKENQLLLHGNLLELAAQVEIQKNNLEIALEYLSDSEKILIQTGNSGLIYARKWKMLINARKAKNLH